MNQPVAWINVEEKKLEWNEPMVWKTPITVKLDKIPLYTRPIRKLTDEEILKMAANKFHFSEYKLVIQFAKDILKKAKE
jgi:hypothetical protein